MNRFVSFVFLSAAVLAGAAGCKPEDELSRIPSIAFVSMEPREVKAASSEDTVFLQFRFSDGDADLGSAPGATSYDIFLVDSRDTSVLQYVFPEIQDELRDPAKGMQGTATIILEAALLVPRDSLHAITGDTLQYDVYVKDRAGNESNHFTTPNIVLTPP